MIDGVECGSYLPGRMIAVAWWGWVANPGSVPRGGVFGLSSTSFIGMAGWGPVWSTDELDPDG
jgi:hypothetical protein